MTQNDRDASQKPPLTGLRVLDLTQFLSGPYITQVFGDLGADIIKLEGPQGDLAREIPPHFVGRDSVYYISTNRNKRSICIDLKRAEGIALTRRLALACDVVIENYRPGVMDRLGLRAAELRREKPALIWCAISGFGQDGPYRDKPAYDMVVQALSGGMSMTGEVGRPAVRAGIPIGDICGGLYAGLAILAALHRRNETGRGEQIDISMLDCQAAMLCYQGAYHLHAGHVPGRQGSGHDSIPTYRSFKASDGIEVVITANTERMWTGLIKALGVPHLSEDARFASNAARYNNRFALWPLLEQAFLARTADEWVPLLEAQSVPVGIVNTLERVVADPQIQHRGMVMAVEAADGRTLRVMGDPIKLSQSEAVAPRFPPSLGADSHEILMDVLALSPDEINQLIEQGTVLTAPAIS